MYFIVWWADFTKPNDYYVPMILNLNLKSVLFYWALDLLLTLRSINLAYAIKAMQIK